MAYLDTITGKSGQPAGSQGTDLTKRQNRKSLFAPVDTMANYMRSPEYNEWANPEQLAATQGVDSIYAGARTAQRDAALNAQRFGLGRGAMTQFQMDARRNAASTISNTMLAAKLLGGERRAQGAMALADIIREAQTGAALANMNRRQSSMTSLFQGGLASAAGKLAGESPKVAGGIIAGVA